MVVITDTKYIKPPTIAESKLRLAIHVAGLGLGDVDYLNDTITLDERAAQLFDLQANTPLPRDILHARIHPEDIATIEYKVASLLSPEGDEFIDVTHRVIHSDGTVLWLNARKQVFFTATSDSENAVPLSGLVAISDITAIKNTETQIKYLMGEINHRSKNLLGIVQSMARMTARSGDTATFNERFSQRLTALASNQDLLVHNEQQHSDLATLAQVQLKPFSIGMEERVSISGPNINLGQSSAQAIGMAFHELATNALKYGSLSGHDGTVSITWSIGNADDEVTDGFKLSWIEAGGPAVTAPTKTGFGEKVIKRMAASAVNGTVDLEYHPTGIVWELKTSLEQLRKA